MSRGRSRNKENQYPMGSTGDMRASSLHIARMKVAKAKHEQSKYLNQEKPGNGNIWTSKLTSPRGPQLQS